VSGSPRIALLSHCLANQNAKVGGYATCPGVVAPVLAVLRAAGYAIIQMPCPEMAFLGARRWWQVREQYDTPGYRRRCRELAASVADVLAARIGPGTRDVIVLGVDGSPSSGVRFTDRGPGWGGEPRPLPFDLVAGRGVWIEELDAVLAARQLPRPRWLGIGLELPDFDEARSLAELRAFLAEAA
jgi:predicted secreted protein